MAEYIVLTDAVITIGTVTLAEEGTSCAIALTAEAPTIGVFGQRNVKIFEGGPTSWSFELEGVLSETTNGASLFAMLGTQVSVSVQATSDVLSESNPAYQGEMVVTAYTPLSGAHGEMRLFSLSGVGATDLARVISAV